MKLSKFIPGRAISLGSLTLSHVRAEHGELTTGPEGIAIKYAAGVEVVPWANVVQFTPMAEGKKA